MDGQGSSDIDQLGKIFAAFGTPKSSQWPDMVCLPNYMEYQYVPAPPLRTLFPTATDDALDLLAKMFTYDPRARISAEQALEHRFVIISHDTNGKDDSHYSFIFFCFSTLFCILFQVFFFFTTAN